MTIHPTTEPAWYTSSHHDRYRRLQKVRHHWCQRPVRDNVDIAGRTVHRDGRWINDVSSLYLSLGEAVNGPNGYFGGCLDSLSDCLNGTFGVLSPLTIRLSRFDKVRNALNARARCRFHAEGFANVQGEDLEEIIGWGYLGDGSPADIAYWTAKLEAALADAPFDCDEYAPFFDGLLQVLEECGAELVPDDEEAR